MPGINSSVAVPWGGSPGEDLRLPGHLHKRLCRRLRAELFSPGRGGGGGGKLF